MADGWSRTDLTLVDPRVLPLRVAYPESPIFRVGRVHRLEPLVRGVRIPPHSQQVDVPVPHPRDLQQKTPDRTH